MAATRAISGEIQYENVPDYALPPLLTTTDGDAVTSADMWQRHRRGELQQLVEQEMMGFAPPLQLPASSGITVHYETVGQHSALNGAAVRHDVVITYAHAASGTAARVNLLLFLPSALGAAAGHRVVCGLNFDGNHTICTDQSVPISEELQALSTPTGAAAAGSSHCVASLLLSDDDIAVIRDPGAIGHTCPIHGGETVYSTRNGDPVGFVRRGRVTGGRECPVKPWTDCRFSAWVYLDNDVAVEGSELAVQTEEGHWVRATVARAALQEERGHSAGRWAIGHAIARGCGIATVWCVCFLVRCKAIGRNRHFHAVKLTRLNRVNCRIGWANSIVTSTRCPAQQLFKRCLMQQKWFIAVVRLVFGPGE